MPTFAPERIYRVASSALMTRSCKAVQRIRLRRVCLGIIILFLEVVQSLGQLREIMSLAWSLQEKASVAPRQEGVLFVTKRTEATSGTAMSRHSLSIKSVLVLTEGCCIIMFDDEDHAVAQGEALLVPPSVAPDGCAP